MESRAKLFKVMERHLGGRMVKEKGNEALAYEEETHPMADCIKLYESLPHPTFTPSLCQDIFRNTFLHDSW